MPGRKDTRLQIYCDDYKLEFAYSLLRDIQVDKESVISRQHHVNVNKKGSNLHVFPMAGSGFPLQVQFQKDGNSLLGCFIDICAGYFNFNCNEVPNLTNWVGLNIDRQYAPLMLILW